MIYVWLGGLNRDLSFFYFVLSAPSPSSAPAAAAGLPGGMPAGFPDLNNLNLSAALSNPALMNMAMQMMNEPAIQNLISGTQAGSNNSLSDV